MMRIEAIIIDKPAHSSFLKECLSSRFPEISICGQACTYQDANRLIKSVNPGLIFSDINIFNHNGLKTQAQSLNCEYEVIYLSEKSEDAVRAFRHEACGFILKPLNAGDIVASVATAIRKICEKPVRVIDPGVTTSTTGLPHTRLIGIPTMKAVEFIYEHEIIRCEGLQKCTRIISMRRSNMISAYNIGEFRKLLEPCGFFSCHKSHLINLMHVKRFTREGFIYLTDNSAVPLARRKRADFLNHLKHL